MDMKFWQYIRLQIKNSLTQISNYNTIDFSRYAHVEYTKCLFTIIQKQ